jgi:hypothetical protein
MMGPGPWLGHGIFVRKKPLGQKILPIPPDISIADKKA